MLLLSRNIWCCGLFSLFLVYGGTAAASDWQIRADQSRVRFEVGHHDYAKPVRGRFHALKGEIDYEPGHGSETEFSISVSIDPASIDTDNRYRDGHLRESFFNVKDFPEIRFSASGMLPEDPKHLDGELTLKGVTHPISLEIMSLRETLGASGEARLRCRAKGTLNRRLFGVEESDTGATGLEKILSGIQQGLDEFIEDEVKFSISIVGTRSIASVGDAD